MNWIKIVLASWLLGGILHADLDAANFFVTNTNNSGVGSFRQAIINANGAAGADVVVFTVAGVIPITGALPGITGPLVINGASAPGYVPCGPPVIALDGGGGSGNGLQLFAGASGSAVLALNVRNFQFNGIQLINTDNCRIAGCYIGTNADGSAAAPNGQNGLQVEVTANNNKFGGSTACERNVIAGNNGMGISIVNCSTDTIAGNYIGLNAAGNATIPNGSGGIIIVGTGTGHVVGGSLAGDRNVISGNGTGLTGNGMHIDGNNSCIVRGNYVGLDASGNVALGNAENGISLNAAADALIGGTGPNDGNVVADHEFHAIVLNGGSNNTVIQGNKCGTNAAGTAALGNNDSGVIVIGTSGVTIGGNTAGHRNLLSGSLQEYGIFLINADNSTVQGNYIGTDITGTQPLPNLGGGIRVDAGTATSLIGGSGAGEANVIAFNTSYGIGLINASDRQILISRNSMFCNTGKGIDLNGVGNNNHPAPVFTSATAGGCTGTSTSGDIIELFYDSLCTATCQGKDFIATVTANGSGVWSYTGPLTVGATLVATARDVPPPPGNADNTSEFSCFVLLPVEDLVFDAWADGLGGAQLQWSTSAEVNSLRFDIEKSSNGVDFHGIGVQNAAGNDPEGREYAFHDPFTGGQQVFYRLKQVDFDGGFEYSKVVVVQAGKAHSSLLVYPQPADGALHFQMGHFANAPFTTSILDLLGKRIFSRKFTDVSASEFSIETAGLPSGMYLLQIDSHLGRIVQPVKIVH